MLSILAISLSAVTTQAAIVLAIALFIVLALSWRRPIRSSPSPRSSHYGQASAVRVARVAPDLYKRPNPVRRFVSLLLGGAMGVLIGTLLAIVIAFTIAFVVIRLTDMLG